MRRKIIIQGLGLQGLAEGWINIPNDQVEKELKYQCDLVNDSIKTNINILIKEDHIPVLDRVREALKGDDQ